MKQELSELASERAKKRVLKKYPKATVKRDGVFFFVSTGKGESKKYLGAGFDENGAWCSAGCNSDLDLTF